MKRCFGCLVFKELEFFYRHKGMQDGRLNKCKECIKKDSTEYRNNNIDSVRRYDRERGNRQDKSYVKEYRAKYPNKYKAHNLVNNSIRDGKLFSEPCEICNESRSEAHHDDYSKPLNVRWLCSAHHSQWHRDNGPGLNE